jgi:1-acyl-sn-glycerol-3-phosphate acyltransferase
LLRTLFFYTTFFPFTLLCIGYLLLSALLGGEERLHASARQWARGCLWLGGVRLRIEGIEHLPVQGPVVYMSNHQGNFDVPVLFAGLPVQFRWLAKAELFKIPIFGRAMRGVGYISIDRSNRKSAFESLERAARTIRNGTSVLIFPEGTRSRDGHILPFKKGGFVLSVDSGVPIVPVIIRGTRDIIPKGRFMIRPAPVTMQILDPVETAGYTRKTKDALLAHIRSILIENFEAERRES